LARHGGYLTRRALATFAGRYDIRVRVATPIDWAFWLALRRVEAWQAVALSLDIDPYSMDRNYRYTRGPGGPSDPAFGPTALHLRTMAEFKKRMTLVDDAMAHRSIVRPPECGHTQLRLSDFVAWFVQLGRGTLPPPLAAAATSRPSQAAPTPSKAAAPGPTDAETRPIQRRKRGDPLTPHVERLGALHGYNTDAVWSELLILAKNKATPAIRIEGDAKIEWCNPDQEWLTLTKKHLSQRLGRAKKAASGDSMS